MPWLTPRALGSLSRLGSGAGAGVGRKSTSQGGRTEGAQNAKPPPDSTYQLLAGSPSFDIWAIGVILYRALAHRPLFDSTDDDHLAGDNELRYVRRKGWVGHTLL